MVSSAPAGLTCLESNLEGNKTIKTKVINEPNRNEGRCCESNRAHQLSSRHVLSNEAPDWSDK